MFNRKRVKYMQYIMTGGQVVLETQQYKKCVEKINQSVNEGSKTHIIKWPNTHGRANDTVDKDS
jgi:hypothetical protein